MKAYVNIVESVLAFIIVIGFVTWIFSGFQLVDERGNLIKFERVSNTLLMVLRSGKLDQHFLDCNATAVKNEMQSLLSPYTVGVKITNITTTITHANTSALLNISASERESVILHLLTSKPTSCNITINGSLVRSITFSDVASINLTQQLDGSTAVLLNCSSAVWAIVRKETSCQDENYAVVSSSLSVTRIKVPYFVTERAKGKIELVVA